MAKQSFLSYKSQRNPLDFWEDISLSRGWAFERPLPTEVLIDVEDFPCPLQVTSSWYELDGYLEIIGVFDVPVPEKKKLAIFEILSSLSVGMRLGSIVLCPSYEKPIFRHSFFSCGRGQIAPEHLVEAADELLLAGEKLSQALQFVCLEDRSSEDAIFAAFMDVVGEA